jgi:hypothetical protein
VALWQEHVPQAELAGFGLEVINDGWVGVLKSSVSWCFQEDKLWWEMNIPSGPRHLESEHVRQHRLEYTSPRRTSSQYPYSRRSH